MIFREFLGFFSLLSKQSCLLHRLITTVLVWISSEYAVCEKGFDFWFTQKVMFLQFFRSEDPKKIASKFAMAFKHAPLNDIKTPTRSINKIKLLQIVKWCFKCRKKLKRVFAFRFWMILNSQKNFGESF